MDFGSGVLWREVHSVTAAGSFASLPLSSSSSSYLASFHTCIHEKFMTVSLSPLTLLIPSPYATLLAQSIHLETDFERGCNRGDMEGGVGRRGQSEAR